jgi:RNA polymerase sigma-70 factor (ECF subfamily)
MDELQFIEGLQRGDTSAIKQLVMDYTTPLCLYSDRFIRNSEDARDIVSESLLVLLEGIHKRKIVINSTINLRSILFTIVKNQSIATFKSRIRLETIVKECHTSHSEDNIHERIEAESYMLEKLHREIDKLPEKQKQLLKMRYFEKLSPPQIAVLQGIAESTVKNQVHAAMKTLRLNFKDDEWQVILLLLCCGSFALN